MWELDFSFLIPYIPQLLDAAKITMKLGVLSFLIALCVCIFVGVLRSINTPLPFKLLLTGYVEVFRGTPLLIQLFFIYYGLPKFGIILEPTSAAIIGLSLNCAAYMSEVVRASIQSVDNGQYEVAYTLGYTKLQTYIYIISPQAFRIALPSFMNYFATIIKETSLVSVLSIAEITRIGNHIYARTLSPFEIYITIGLFYFIINCLVSMVAKIIERRSNIWIQ